jgi:hypothetical protein
MGLREIIFGKPPIRNAEALAEFVESNAAFVAQKGIYEYSRARAGHYSKVMFREDSFRAAVEMSRWRAFPLGLAMVGEITEGVLRPYAQDRAAFQEALAERILDVFDRYPVSEALGAAAWRELRAALDHRLRLIGLHPVKRAMDVPEPVIQAYFDLMPIHEKLRASDYPTLRNYLRVAMCNIHAEFETRVDAPAVTASLSAVEAL